MTSVATERVECGSKSLHAEIIKAAAPFLKKHGTSAPVDAIMKAAGLTSGAMYSQFKNKEDLCIKVICGALDATLDRYRTLVGERGRQGLKLIVAEYLSEDHLRGVADGCAFAALGTDMAKATPRAKRAYEPRIQALVQIFVDGLGAGSEKERQTKAQHFLSTMLGALTFARAMSDADAAQELLSQVRASVLHQLDTPVAK
jgi:TetR/AcrR family transcriptional repressor of nem operon